MKIINLLFHKMSLLYLNLCGLHHTMILSSGSVTGRKKDWKVNTIITSLMINECHIEIIPLHKTGHGTLPLQTMNCFYQN